jgi:crotonobetainyl-CoA:carnitine CoA-transferase CaiB-like acyl-CoA transferase
MSSEAGTGPLAGVRVVEMEGIGPAPVAAMLLADLGAEIVRVERRVPANIGIARPRDCDYGLRGRQTVKADLKDEADKAMVLDLVRRADALVEGYRPGVMERLGLGPETCLKANPRLVYGRMTGWGQAGPLATTAGHDINYLALTGVLDRLGRAGEPPAPPINLLGDFGGGSMLMAFGLLAGIVCARATGRGQVVDAAILDGVSLLAAPLMGLVAAGIHDRGRGENLLDGGAPHYGVYACADGLHLAVGAIEDKFRTLMLAGFGFDPSTFPDLDDRRAWPDARRLLGERIATRPRGDWVAIFEGTDACVTPVLTFDEAAAHPHNRARAAHIDIAGRRHPAPGPRFSETPAGVPASPARRGEDMARILERWAAAAAATPRQED